MDTEIEICSIKKADFPKILFHAGISGGNDFSDRLLFYFIGCAFSCLNRKRNENTRDIFW